MNKEVQRRLNAATVALEFIRAHPSDDSGYTTLGGELEAGIGRLVELGKAQSGASADAGAATAEFRSLRRQAQRGTLRMIVKAGAIVPRKDGEAQSPFRTVLASLTKYGFLNEARSLLDKAAEHADVIAPRGATPDVVAKARGLVDDAAAALDRAVRARNARVAATTTLQKAMGDVSDLLVRLDAYNEYHFADQPELLSAWQLIRHGGPRRRRQNGTEPTPGGDGTPDAPATPVTPTPVTPEATTPAPEAGSGGEHAA